MCESINEASKYGKVNERKMDIDLCCKKIEEEGYSVFVAFYDFIKKYGGLYGFHSAYKDTTINEAFFIDPERASNRIFIERVNDYIERAGYNMIPVGECSNGHITLLYGENNVIYGGLDDYLWKYGDNLSSSIDILINGKEAVEIP